MSEGYMNRTGAQTHKATYLPPRLSRNTPTFAITSGQHSKTSLEEEELTIVELTGKDKGPQRRPGSPLPGTEVYDQQIRSRVYKPMSRYGCLPNSTQMTGDFVNIPEYSRSNSFKRNQKVNSFRRYQHDPYENVTTTAYRPTYSTDDFSEVYTVEEDDEIEASTTYRPSRLRDGFRQVSTYRSSLNKCIGREDTNAYLRVQVPYDEEFRHSSYTGAKTSFNTAFLSTKPTGKSTSVSYKHPKYHPSNIVTRPPQRNVKRNGYQIRHVPLPSSQQIFNKFHYDNTDRRGFSTNISTSNYRKPAFRNNADSYHKSHFRYVDRDTNTDNDFQTNLDFGNESDEHATEKHCFFHNNNRERGSDADSSHYGNTVDRGVSAIALPQEFSTKFSKKNKQAQLPVANESQNERISYMTLLSKYYSQRNPNLRIKASSVSNQPVLTHAMQSPIFHHLRSSLGNQPQADDIFANIQRTYRSSSIPEDKDKNYRGKMYTMQKTENTYPIQRQFSPPELDGNYVSSRTLPSALNRTYNISAGRRSSPSSVLSSTMNRTMSTLHARNRCQVTYPAAIRKRSPETIENKRVDILENKKKTRLSFSETNGVSFLPRRASTIDIACGVDEIDLSEAPLYRSYSDSSIDITDESSYSPVAIKRSPGVSLRRFKPLPKLHEESNVDTDFGVSKESDYFQDSEAACHRTQNASLRKVFPLILSDMDTTSSTIPAMGGVAITTPRRHLPLFRHSTRWDESWEQESLNPETPSLESPNDSAEEWKETSLHKDDDQDLHNLAESVVESLTETKDAKPTIHAQTNLPNITSSTKTFEDSFQSENNSNKSDIGSQVHCSTKTKGIQVMGSKMLKTFPPKIKRRKIAEEMYQSINEDILY